jgi:hypothetical protein
MFALKYFVFSSLDITVRQIIKTKFLDAANVYPVLPSCTVFVDSKAHSKGPV